MIIQMKTRRRWILSILETVGDGEQVLQLHARQQQREMIVFEATEQIVLAQALLHDLSRFPWKVTAQTLRERFREDRLGLTASSLTFTTILALVPFFTVALAVFSAAILAVFISGVALQSVATWSMAFVALRIVYIPMYIGNQDKLRSLVFIAGFGICIYLFYLALNAN